MAELNVERCGDCNNIIALGQTRLRSECTQFYFDGNRDIGVKSYHVCTFQKRGIHTQNRKVVYFGVCKVSFFQIFFNE